MSSYMLRSTRVGIHIRVDVFAGTDKQHRAHTGTLMFREGREADMFIDHQRGFADIEDDRHPKPPTGMCPVCGKEIIKPDNNVWLDPDRGMESTRPEFMWHLIRANDVWFAASGGTQAVGMTLYQMHEHQPPEGN